MKDFIYYLFHYKKIVKELRVLRERKEESQLLVANYIDKIKRLEKENYRLDKYNDELKKEYNEMLESKNEKVIMSIHMPTDYGEQIHEFTNYGNYTVYNTLDLSKTRIATNKENILVLEKNKDDD